MKKYKEYIKEANFFNLNDLDDDLLKEKIFSLKLTIDDLQDEVNHINKLLRSRKEKADTDYSINLPTNIFDLNKEQFDFIFENHHGISSAKYKISTDYFTQLTGVSNIGFIPETKQFSFCISTYKLLDDLEENYVRNEDVIKTLNFLIKNLKKLPEGYIKFQIYYSYSDYDFHEAHFIDENNITINNKYRTIKSFTDINSFLKYIATKDIDDK